MHEFKKELARSSIIRDIYVFFLFKLTSLLQIIIVATEKVLFKKHNILPESYFFYVFFLCVCPSPAKFWVMLRPRSGKQFVTWFYLAHLLPIHPFSTPWKHQKTVRFSDVFREARKGALGRLASKLCCWFSIIQDNW